MVTPYEQDQFTSVATLPATPLTCAGKICFAHPQAIVNIDTTPFRVIFSELTSIQSGTNQLHSISY